MYGSYYYYWSQINAIAYKLIIIEVARAIIALIIKIAKNLN